MKNGYKVRTVPQDAHRALVLEKRADTAPVSAPLVAYKNKIMK